MSIVFVNDTATTEIYTLSLHDALPISILVDMRNHYESEVGRFKGAICPDVDTFREELQVVEDLMKDQDRKSTRLNSSHANISYAVFCLKKNKLLSTPPLAEPGATCDAR